MALPAMGVTGAGMIGAGINNALNNNNEKTAFDIVNDSFEKVALDVRDGKIVMDDQALYEIIDVNPNLIGTPGEYDAWKNVDADLADFLNNHARKEEFIQDHAFNKERDKIVHPKAGRVKLKKVLGGVALSAGLSAMTRSTPKALLADSALGAAAQTPSTSSLLSTSPFSPPPPPARAASARCLPLSTTTPDRPDLASGRRIPPPPPPKPSPPSSAPLQLPGSAAASPQASVGRRTALAPPPPPSPRPIPPTGPARITRLPGQPLKHPMCGTALVRHSARPHLPPPKRASALQSASPSATAAFPHLPHLLRRSVLGCPPPPRLLLQGTAAAACARPRDDGGDALLQW